jgi:arylsulfatase A-like enzyme
MNSQKPNIVYVFADQLRLSCCGYAGDAKAKTPNIDKLSAESVSFTNAISGHPVCAPYRASLFTGKYTTSTGMVINEIRMNPHHHCLAHVLHEHGYDTAYIGKWHLWANELGTPTELSRHGRSSVRGRLGDFQKPKPKRSNYRLAESLLCDDRKPGLEYRTINEIGR